jgi:hypothetical protein
MSIFIVSIVIGFVLGLALLSGSERKKIQSIGIFFLAVVLFCIITLIYNSALAVCSDLSSMEMIASGRSVTTIDCYGRSAIRVNEIDMKCPFPNDFWRQESRTGDGSFTNSVSFVEGNNYTIYKQNGFIFHNYIVVCDK